MRLSFPAALCVLAGLRTIEPDEHVLDDLLGAVHLLIAGLGAELPSILVDALLHEPPVVEVEPDEELVTSAPA